MFYSNLCKFCPPLLQNLRKNVSGCLLTLSEMDTGSVYSPYFNVYNIFFFQEQKWSNGIKVLVISVLCFGVCAFQSSKKVGGFTEQDVSLYIQTFQVV